MNSFWVELLGASVYPLAGCYRTRVIEAGEGEPLGLLHGTGGHAENYIRNIAPLSRRHRVIAVDLGGTGARRPTPSMRRSSRRSLTRCGTCSTR
jgi:pimeloyl-ACP methyl ester carboxylesterase